MLNMPKDIDASQMSKEQLNVKLETEYNDCKDTLSIKELKDSFNIFKKKDDTVENILCAFYNKPIKDILKMKIKDKDSIVDFGDDVGDEIL